MEESGRQNELALTEEPRIECAKWALARRLSHSVRQCSCRSTEIPAEVHFLWIYLDRQNVPGLQAVPVEMPAPLSREEWQGVLDEAAGMGVVDVTFSIGEQPNLHPHLWELALYAQETYGMMVGVHFTGEHLPLADVAAIKSLDLEHTRLYVNDGLMSKLRHALGADWKIYPADFTPARGEDEPCDLPKDMVFVSADGQMYTCGFVHGHDEYAMGSVYEQPLEKKLNCPSAKRAVTTNVAYHHRGCEGCPPLIAQAIARGSF